jgi:predicted MFS family arabinose efflux permease
MEMGVADERLAEATADDTSIASTPDTALSTTLGFGGPAFRLQRMAVYLILGFSYAAVLGFDVIQYVFYDAMLVALDVTNLQLGLLLTIEATGAVFLAIPCGILVDRLDCRHILFAAVLLTAIACLTMALHPSYSVALFAWSVLAVTLCAFYSSVFKLVRLIALPGGIGRSYGLFGMCNAIGFIVLNALSLNVYALLGGGNGTTAGVAVEVAGLKGVFWVFTVALFVCGLSGFLLLRGVNMPVREEAHSDRFFFADVKIVLRMPGTWLVFISSFTIFTLHATMGYFTPYFTGVLGTAAVFSGVFAIVRQYGLRLLMGPLGGLLGDHIRSNAKIILGGLILASCMIGIVMGLPVGTTLVLVVAVTLLLALADNLLVSLCYSVFDDALIPTRYTGTVLGVITVVLPDLFIPALYGSWLDSYGTAAYTFIFLFAIAVNLAGIIAVLFILRRRRRAQNSDSVIL